MVMEGLLLINSRSHLVLELTSTEQLGEKLPAQGNCKHPLMGFELTCDRHQPITNHRC